MVSYDLIYYILGPISLISTFYSAGSIMCTGTISPITSLVLYLHLTVITVNIVSFPNLYNHSDGLCKAVAWIRIYASIANSASMLLLVLVYRNLFIMDSWKIIIK